MFTTKKEKGDLLEKIVGKFCSGIKNAKVENNAKLLGKSGVSRQIDTLIDGEIGTFAVKIIIDSKNHTTPIDINSVESMEGTVSDVGANLGVIVCPTGFTDGAKKRAADAGIQLYEIFDESLGNSNLFIPLRYIEGKLLNIILALAELRQRATFLYPQIHQDGYFISMIKY